ncbi:MAG: zinc ribbon domain-containing protein [Chthoniobacterales bacterium]
MKKCPYCAEDIQDDAVKCRHCMEFLDGSVRSVSAAAPGIAERWYNRTGVIILTFLIMPPLALPLIWIHPKLPVVWKVVTTIMIGLICLGMYWTSVVLMDQLEAVKHMLNEMQP